MGRLRIMASRSLLSFYRHDAWESGPVRIGIPAWRPVTEWATIGRQRWADAAASSVADIAPYLSALLYSVWCIIFIAPLRYVGVYVFWN